MCSTQGSCRSWSMHWLSVASLVPSAPQKEARALLYHSTTSSPLGFAEPGSGYAQQPESRGPDTDIVSQCHAPQCCCLSGLAVPPARGCKTNILRRPRQLLEPPAGGAQWMARTVQVQVFRVQAQHAAPAAGASPVGGSPASPPSGELGCWHGLLWGLARSGQAARSIVCFYAVSPLGAPTTGQYQKARGPIKALKVLPCRSMRFQDSLNAASSASLQGGKHRIDRQSSATGSSPHGQHFNDC